MTSNDEELAAIYGPAATFSEHKRGAAITYTPAEGGAHRSGTIIWVAAARQVAGRQLPLQYIVAPDVDTGFIDVVAPGDVIEGGQAEEPTMKRCPYCHNLHQANQVEQCPMKPHDTA